MPKKLTVKSHAIPADKGVKFFLPAPLEAYIRAQQKMNYRTFSGQIVWMLEYARKASQAGL